MVRRTIKVKVPLHSWKQEKITGWQVWGVGGGGAKLLLSCFREKLQHT